MDEPHVAVRGAGVPARRLLSILLAAGGVLLTALALWTAWSSVRPPAELGVPPESRVGPLDPDATSRAATLSHSRSALPAVAASRPLEPGLTLRPDEVPATAPTRGGDGRYSHVRFQVVDQLTGAPLTDVAVVRGTSGGLLGHTSPTGRIALRACLLGELVFARDGYLVTGLEAHSAAWRAADAAAARGDEVRVALLEDQFTVPLRLRFVDAEGRLVPDVRFTVRHLAEPQVSSLAVPRLRFAPGTTMPPEFTRAWNTHVRYTRLAQFTSLCHHYGLESEHEVFAAQAGVAELRLIALGAWQVSTLAAGGARGDAKALVEGLDGGDCTVVLGPGRTLRGRVLAADDRTPVAGALVAVSPAALLLAPATTDAAGRFVLGGLAGREVQLDVRGEGFEARVVGPLPLDGDEQTIQLVRRRTVRLFGRVEERGSQRAVVGAVLTLEGGGHCRSDATGAFVLDVPLQSSIALEIAADGYHPYVEQLDSESGNLPVQFQLLPRDLATLLRLRLVSRLRGTVVDRQQAPVAGALVDLQPSVPTVVGGIPGRAVVRGLLPADVRRVNTDAQGAFELVTPLDGELVLATYDGGTRIDTPLHLPLGSDRAGLVLRR